MLRFDGIIDLAKGRMWRGDDDFSGRFHGNEGSDACLERWSLMQ